MNYLLILLLSSFGLIMGFLSIYGYTRTLEPWLWLFFALITSMVVARNVNEKVLLHCLAIGLAWGILNALVTSAFFNQYLSSNPQYANSFKQISFMNPRFFGLITGPVIGLLTGLFMGGITYLIRKFL